MNEKRATMHASPPNDKALPPMSPLHGYPGFRGRNETLLGNAGPMGLTRYGHERSLSRESSRAPSQNGVRMSRRPTLPNLSGGNNNEPRRYTSRDSVRISREPTIPNVGMAVPMEETAEVHHRAGTQGGHSGRASTIPNALLPGRAV